ncbi:phosphatidylinositol 4-kinase beta 1 [Impatiens glandulifera]|uniref:phosphatidylinositol 4-kinase beta 1 n=1 Tax=Impatiens glandulifera TaxID=253017 RepID=UPI001FB0A065|nr:phosphatidylinositol 4-kinase beta 1 [Impatiens glandulifera]
MVRLLGLTRSESEPREIKQTNPISETVGGNGWLVRFFDSSFFCEWIAVSYLYKHEHSGVRDYLCNRMYTLPLSGIESYLFQICYMMVHKPSPSLDKFVIDTCSESLKIALKVHWFLLAEIEDTDDNEGISRIQEKCQIAATLMGDWSPLLQPQNAPSSPLSKNQVLNKLLSSKQRLLSLTSSPPTQRSVSFSPSSANSLQDDGIRQSSEENNIFKKFIPGQKVRDAFFLRKSVERDDDESDKDGLFRRLLRDSKDEDVRNSVEKDNEEEVEKDGFFRRLLRDSSKSEVSRKSIEKDEEEPEKEGFFKRLLKDSKDEEGDLNSSSDGFLKRLFRDSKNDSEEKVVSKSVEEDEKGLFRKLFKEKPEDKKEGIDKSDAEEKGSKSIQDGKDSFLRKFFKEKNDDEGKTSKSVEQDEKDGFFKKFFKDKPEEKREGNDKANEEGKLQVNGEEEEPSDFSLFRRFFRVHPDGSKIEAVHENGSSDSVHESSPGSESFFRKLFRDHNTSQENSELFGSKKHEKHPGSLKQLSSSKPPLPNYSSASQFRKGAYHESLDFVLSLCDTSYGLVDVFPVEDRKTALCESLAEINAHVASAQESGGVCFPMGKGVYRVLHIPEDEAVLLNSREKAPYLICVEVVKTENPSSKASSHAHKFSKGGIPLANGDAFLPKPPPWAYPLSTTQDMYHNGYDRVSTTASQAIDQAMSQFWDSKLKLVRVSLSVENISSCQEMRTGVLHPLCRVHSFSSQSLSPSNNCQCKETPPDTWQSVLVDEHDRVKVVLKVDTGVNMDDIVDENPPRRKEHRRVPSTIAMEEVKAATLKGEAPPGLPLKGAGQDSSDATQKDARGGFPKATDPLSGELWEAKKERIRKASVHGTLPGWDLRSMIVKSGDDCRQEHLAVQLISHFYDIFQEAGLPLWLRPYEVLVTSSYTALIETIPDTASIHSIKSRYPNVTSLREFFVAKYQENSPSFKLAQRNFVESMAGYSLVCYLIQIKDRHNGNLLLDEEGHIIHIDFGFMLSNSPGGVNFESAPFKLTRELLEVMDSDAEGIPSEFFDYFKVLCIQGFLTCRKHAERIILLVEMLEDSGFPCFKGGPRCIQNLRKRFHLSLTEEQCVSLVLSLISSSLDAWRTRQYDYYQRVLNGIL